MYYLTPALNIDFGVKTSSLVPISTDINKNKQTPALSHFLYNKDNGRIYYASGGAIHYVATYSAFVAYGGLRTPATTVDTSTLDLFVEAQAVY
jgi:hypothetical protein